MNIFKAYLEAIGASIGTDDTLANITANRSMAGALIDNSMAKAFINKHRSNHRQGLFLYQDLQVALEKEAILYYKEEPTNMQDFLDSFDKDTTFLKVYKFEDDSYLSLNYVKPKDTCISVTTFTEISKEEANNLFLNYNRIKEKPIMNIKKAYNEAIQSDRLLDEQLRKYVEATRTTVPVYDEYDDD